MNENSNILFLILGITICLFMVMVPFANRLSRKRSYTLEDEEKKRLEIRANNSWRRCQVYFDGTLLGKVNNKRELVAGREFILPDSSVVKVQLIKLFLSYSELQVWHNGQALQDFTPFSGDALNFNKGIAGITVVGIFPFIWLITLVSLRLIINHQLILFPGEMPIILSYTAWGLFYLTLAFFAHRKSLISMFAATFIYLLDGALGVLLYLSLSNALIGSGQLKPLALLEFSFYLPWGIAFLVMHLFILVLMFQGIGALIMIKRKGSPGSSFLNTLILAVMVCAAVGSIFIVQKNPAILISINSFYTQTTLPISDLTSSSSREITNPSIDSPTGEISDSMICWTREVTGFSGNRSLAWDTLLDPQVKTLLLFNQFKDQVIEHNKPQLMDDGYIFYSEKTYQFPVLCP